MYNLIYDAQQNITGVTSNGANLPYNPAAETFDETDPLVVELRQWEAANNIDLIAWGKRYKLVETIRGNLVYNDKIYVSFNFVNLVDTSSIILAVDRSYDIFLNQLILNYQVDGKNETNKNWEFNLYRVNTSLGFTLIDSSNSLSADYDSLQRNLNLEDKIALNSTLFYSLEAVRVGKPGSISLSGQLVYQHSKNL